MNKMICIYHSRDLDGWMSAAIVKLKFPNIELLPWDYGQEIPDLSFKEIVMVDVSFPKEIMAENANRLIWIDHHISAIKDIASLEPLPFIEGRRNDKFAACELTWQYFFPEEKMPELVRLLGRYDCFGHKGTEEEQKVLEFQYGARQVINNINEAYELLVVSRRSHDGKCFDIDICENIHIKGSYIYKYLCIEAVAIYARKFDIILDGFRFASVNQCRFNPINFGIDYHKDGYDGFACFHFQNGKWNYSLYNDNGLVDCSIIAKNRGGGGHKGAAGFITDEIIKS